MDKRIEDINKKINNKSNQRLTRLQLQTQQPRIAVKVDVIKDKKTRICKQYATPDERFGDISSAQVNDSTMSRI